MKEMKVSLEHLIFLPPNSALALLLAVWPICRSVCWGCGWNASWCAA